MNKTKIINALTYMWISEDDKQLSEYKEINDIKRKLRNTTKDNIESIKHSYEQLITLYFLSAKQQINKSLQYNLKKAIKLILESNVKIDFWAMDEIKSWYDMGML